METTISGPLILMATADSRGTPHISPAQDIELAPHERIEIEACFCAQTVANLRDNPGVSVVVWDRFNDRGVQIRGRLEGVGEPPVLDGLPADGEQIRPRPPVRCRLTVVMEQVSQFCDRVNGDAAVEPEGVLQEVITPRVQVLR